MGGGGLEDPIHDPWSTWSPICQHQEASQGCPPFSYFRSKILRNCENLSRSAVLLQVSKIQMAIITMPDPKMMKKSLAAGVAILKGMIRLERLVGRAVHNARMMGVRQQAWACCSIRRWHQTGIVAAAGVLVSPLV